MNDEPRDIRQDQESRQEEKPSDGPAPPKRLLRAREGRLVWGAAAGLARYFGVDPVIVRVGFLVAIFFGGLGLFAYLALAVFIPAGDEEVTIDGEAPPAPFQVHPWLGVGAGLLLVLFLVPAVTGDFWHWGPVHGGWILVPLAAGAVVYLILNRPGPPRPVRGPGGRFREAAAGGVDSPAGPGVAGQQAAAEQGSAASGDTGTTDPGRPSRQTARRTGIAVAGFIGFTTVFLVAVVCTALGWGTLLAVVLAGAGVVLVVGGLLGTSRWMVVPVVALALGITVAVAAGFEVEGGFGNVDYRPVSVADIPADGYPLAAGRMVVDLRDLDWADGQILPLRVALGAGQATVLVPEKVCVNFALETAGGDLVAGGQRVSGLFVDSASRSGRGTPRLELDGSVQFGQLQVIADDALVRKADGRQGRLPEPDTDRQREINRKACAA